MIRLAHCFFLSLLTLCFVVFGTYPASAQEENRYIKMIGVDDEYINLDVDGKEVRIPLPGGYVVADKQLYSKLYERLIDKSIIDKDNNVEDILLCILIHSDDDKYKKRNISFKGYRYCYFKVDYDYKKYRITQEIFINEIENLKYVTNALVEETNQYLSSIGLSPFSGKFIFENEKILSFTMIEKWPSQKQYRSGFSKNYIFLQPLIITFLMYHNIYNDFDLAQLEEETIVYANQVSE